MAELKMFLEYGNTGLLLASLVGAYVLIRRAIDATALIASVIAENTEAIRSLRESLLTKPCLMDLDDGPEAEADAEDPGKPRNGRQGFRRLR